MESASRVYGPMEERLGRIKTERLPRQPTQQDRRGAHRVPSPSSRPPSAQPSRGAGRSVNANLAEAPKLDLSDESMRRAARFTDHLPLADYAKDTPPLSSARQRGHGEEWRPNTPDATKADGCTANCAVGRGGAHPRQRRHAAARPARHRLAVHERYYAPRASRRSSLPSATRAVACSIFRKPQAISNHAHTHPRIPALPFRIALVGRHRSTRGHRSVHP